MLIRVLTTQTFFNFSMLCFESFSIKDIIISECFCRCDAISFQTPSNSVTENKFPLESRKAVVAPWFNKHLTIFKYPRKQSPKINSTQKSCNVNQRLSRACIVHLVIKKTNWSNVNTMSCSGSHLGITINIKNTKFVKDLPMIDSQLRFNQCNSFREEYISVFSPYGPVLILWPMVAAILDFRSA